MVWLEGGGRGSYAHILKSDIDFDGNVVHIIDSGIMRCFCNAHCSMTLSLLITTH